MLTTAPSRVQVNCSVLTVGPGGHRLNSSYQNRENVNYKEDLGRSIVALARVVPDGMLLFFPSYGVLKSACDAWKASAVWKELEGVKPVIVEPRDAKDFAAVRCLLCFRMCAMLRVYVDV